MKRLSLGAATAVLLLGSGSASAQPLNRDIDSYFLFAQKFVRVKDLVLETNCNVGVNCKAPSDHSKCGLLGVADAFFADGVQAAGDRTQCRAGADLWQLFKNNPNTCNTITLRNPPLAPLDPLPILANLDNDANPSCGNVCDPDYGDVEVACGFPANFPACGANDVIIQAGGDGCTGDLVNGNGRCDLGPGTYGAIIVRDRGNLDFKPGNYNICSLKVGREAKVTAKGANLYVADGGFVRAGGGSLIAQDCGELTIKIKGKGRLSFGRHLSVAMKVCAPESKIKLGHANNLRGQFIGDSIVSDSENHGQCCGGGRCACFDSFTPTTAAVGADITLTSACDLTSATGVKICGINATVVSQSATEIKAKVPAGATGQCNVELVSPVGVFKAIGKLTVP